MSWRMLLLRVDGVLCLAMPSLARYTIDAHFPVSGAVFHMDSVNLRSARNAAVLALSFRAEAEEKLSMTPHEDLPQYRVRSLLG